MGWEWRAGRDSNPRNAFTFAGFQDRSNQPLCHLPDVSGFSLRTAQNPVSRSDWNEPQGRGIVTGTTTSRG